MIQKINIYQLQEIIIKGLEAMPGSKYDNITTGIADKFIYIMENEDTKNERALALVKVL